MKQELREVLEKTADWLEALAKLSATTLDDQAVAVFKAILDSPLLSTWLSDQVYSYDSSLDVYQSLNDDHKSAITSAGFSLAEIMWFINVVLPTVQKFVADWLPKKDPKPVGFAAQA